MGGLGLLYALLVIIPFWRLLPRFGIPNWVSIATIIPIVALVLLWVMAFRDELTGPAGKS
ncbi:MAG: hypothetical protein HUJ27_06910 [Rhodobacteraceae bacterium]|nr:hypothetical protein [Paracoccaceae bacterium]